MYEYLITYLNREAIKLVYEFRAYHGNPDYTQNLLYYIQIAFSYL